MTDEQNVGRVAAAVLELNKAIREVSATGISLCVERDNTFPPDVEDGCPFDVLKLTRAERFTRYLTP